MKPHRPIKRSKTTALLLMSTAPLWLTACGEKKATEEGLYTSVEACIEATGEPSSCRIAFKEASEQAADTAPQYARVEDCAKDYPVDQCVPQQTQAGHSFIGPMMAGFFLSRMLSGNSAGLTSQPAFKDNTNNWAKPAAPAALARREEPQQSNSSGGGGSGGSGGLATNSRIGQGKSGLAPVKEQPNQPIRTTTAHRSGFGASGSTRSVGT